MERRVFDLLAANLVVTVITGVGELVLFTLLCKRIYAICCRKRIEDRKNRQK